MLKQLKNALMVIGLFLSVAQAATISGTVSDSSSGDKLAGIIAQLRSGNRTVAIDTTDNAGAYSFSSVDSGNYTIRVTNTGYVQKSVTANVGSADLTVNVQLVKIVTYTVSGIVKDSATGKALSGAIVSIGSYTISARDTTGADGAYSLSGITGGNQTITASLTGYTTRSTTVNVTGTAPITKDIALIAIVKIEISGKVTDSTSGDALSGVVVSSGYGSNASRDTTGTDGTYSLSVVAGGNQTITASLTGYASRNITVNVTGTAPITQNIKLFKTITATVSGKVTDSISGKALERVTVSVGTGMTAKRATTDSTGSYSITGVAGGNQTISASLTGYISKSVTVNITGSSPVTQDIALVAVVKTSISGKITDSISGAAVPGAIVRIGTGGSSQRDTAGTDGSYSFDSVSSGPQTISVTLTGYISKTVNVTLSGSSPNVQNIAINKIVITSIIGKVTDSVSGAALKGAIVRIGNGGSSRRDTTGTDGTYKIDSVSSGSVTLQISLNGYVSKSVTVNVVGSSPVTVNIALRSQNNAVIYGLNIKKTGEPAFSITKSGEITLKNISSPGELKIFNLSGKLIFKQSIINSVSAVQLPQYFSESGIIVKFATGNKVYVNRITPLR